jgi:ATP/maltotriose-dependent transcriptional regulator MalT
VKTHVARLFEKLRVARRTEAILLAREFGLVP